jgi:hypothetical protein
MRRLGRSDIEVPSLIWRVSRDFDRHILKAAGGDWVFAPARGFKSDLRDLNVLVGIEAEALRPRGTSAIEKRLAELGLERCAGIVLQGASADDVKSGWPLHRLAAVRERNLARLIVIEAAGIADAQWLVESSPAHAVIVPYGVEDLTAGFSLLDTAMEVGTAILATRPTAAVWSPPPDALAYDVQMRTGDDRIAASIEPLPASPPIPDLPLSAEAREELWKQFRAQVPPPPPLKGGHPPEYGA